MCGITGIVQLTGRPVDSHVLDRMTDALAHRGPDGRGTFIDRHVGLGHRRLAILDLSPAGAQPMHSPDGNLTITFNGEIYNFWEERSALEAKGYRFRSRCDTEVILALYEEYGSACVHHLRGMFAFAIYDKRTQQLFCARDRAGEKPFKYVFDGQTFLFASELKALREHPACPRAIDPTAIHHFLTMMYLPAPLTGFRGIQKLEAGCTLLLDCATKKLTIERYWSPDYGEEERLSESAWCERVRSLVTESVKLRMLADVPVGAFLSGGIDSGVVVLLMGRAAGEPVHTFSIGTPVVSANELPDAERIALRAKTRHHPAVVEPDIVELLPKLVHIYEEPYGDASAIPTYLVSEHASHFVKVVLSGDGGDENFAGYVRYPIARFSRFWERCAPLHPIARAGTVLFHALARNTFSYRCRRFQETMRGPWPERYLQYVSYFTEEEKRGIYAPSFRASTLPRTDLFFTECAAACRTARDTLHAAQCMDFTTYLCDNLMPKADMASMHFGLECRAPLLDHLLIETMARAPASLQMSFGRKKHLFKRAFADLLPPSHLRRRKTGFRLPLDHRFRSDLKPFVMDRLLADAPYKWEFFDRQGIERFLRDYYGSRVNFSDYVWELLWLDEWFRQVGS